MNLATAFFVLKAHYKNHTAVAASLGFNKDHYRAMRNGRVPIPQRTAEYIILKASEIDAVSCVTHADGDRKTWVAQAPSV